MLASELINVTYDDSYTVSQLKEIANKMGIENYSTMKKSELLEVLNNAQ